jgi:hypothetical protein
MKKGGKASALSKAKDEAGLRRAKESRRASELLALIARRKARIVEDFYDIGEALRELFHKELYRALGHRSFEAMLKAHDVMSATQARKLITLVERIPRAEALALGQEKAYALVSYTTATPEPDVPAELARADAKIGGKKLSKVSVRGLEAAAKQARGRARALKPKSPADKQRAAAEKALLTKVKERLVAGGIRGAHVELGANEVRITVTRKAVERW